MRNTSKNRLIATNVLLKFEDGSVSFSIPLGATFADISEYSEKIAMWHRGEPLSIDVRFQARRDNGRRRARAHSLISFPISPF